MTGRRHVVRVTGVPVLLAVALALGGLAGWPLPALAHVKYFEDFTAFPLRWDLVFSGRTAVLIALAASALGSLLLLRRFLHARGVESASDWPALPVFRQMSVGAPAILAVNGGISLAYAASSQAFLAPHLLPAQPALVWLLAAAQYGIALAFITGIGDWIASLVLMLLWLAGLVLFGPFDMLEQAHWLGIAAVMLVIGRQMATESRAREWFRREPRPIATSALSLGDARSAAATASAPGRRAWADYAVTALRVSSGIAVLAAALGEKVWNPALGERFIQNRPAFNVLRLMPGLEWVSDELFVLVAGLTEGVIGILLISGVMPRVVILGMFLPFHLGLPFLPAQELLGHLPFFGMMYLVLVHRRGQDGQALSA